MGDLPVFLGKKVQMTKNKRCALLLLLLWFVYISVFWFDAVTVGRAGNLYVSHINLWGDWTVHFTMGARMAYDRLLLEESPFLIGSQFIYPFGANLLSALLIRAGVEFTDAFVFPSYLFSLLFPIALYCFYRAVLGTGTCALLATCIFIAGGGMGFLSYANDIVSSKTPLETALNPPRDYAQLDSEGIVVGSVVEDMLIPQRSFTHGFPLTLLALSLIYLSVFRREGSEPKRSWLLAASVLLGCMPIIHTHSFFAAFVILGGWCVASLLRSAVERRRVVSSWILVAGVTAGIATPLLLFLFSDLFNRPSHFSFVPGWYASERQMSFFLFWWRNWGLVPVMALVGLFFLMRNTTHRVERLQVLALHSYAFVFFALVNLFQLAPWLWDNTKVLIWAFVGFAALAAQCIHHLWMGLGGVWTSHSLKRPARVLCGFLFIFSVATGVIDLFRILSVEQRFLMYNNEEQYVSEWAKVNTSSESVWLLGPRIHSGLSALSGRQVLVTNERTVWSHGYDYGEVLGDVYQLLRHPQDQARFEKYRVDYILLSDADVRSHGITRADYAAHFVPLLRTEQYSLYARRPPANTPKFSDPLGIEEKPLEVDEPIFLQSVEHRTSLSAGLRRSVYIGQYFSGKPRFTDTVTRPLEFSYRMGDEHDYVASPFSATWSGYLRVPDSGTLELSLTSDDGSWLELDSKRVIINGGVHGPRERTAKVEVGKGYLPITVRYFDSGGESVLSLRWRNKQGSFETIPPEYFFHSDS